jgi:hypothetical protein
LAGLARAQRREGNLEEAVTSIEAALKILETSRGSLGNRELQVTYFAMHRSWYEAAVDLCMQLHAQHPAKGYAQLAFNYTERARARSLLDTLYASGYSASAPVPENVREAYARNRQAISDQQSILSRSTEQTSSDPALKLQRLYSEQETLEAEMQSADRRLTSLLAQQTVDIPFLQHQLLEDHSILLSYWISASHSYRWTITSINVLVDTLPPRDELDSTILPLERMLQTRRSSLVPGEDITTYASRQSAYEVQLQTALSRAGSTLLSRIPKTTRSIFVVSDGSLMSLLFAALRIPDGTATSYAIRRYTFFAEPSASVAAYLKQHPATEQPLRIAVFADPVFSRNDSRVVTTPRLTPTANSHLLFTNMPRLTDSHEETRQILHLAPAGTVALRTGFDATPEQLRTLKPTDASILHFATHTVTRHRPHRRRTRTRQTRDRNLSGPSRKPDPTSGCPARPNGTLGLSGATNSASRPRQNPAATKQSRSADLSWPTLPHAYASTRISTTRNLHRIDHPSGQHARLDLHSQLGARIKYCAFGGSMSKHIGAAFRC